MASLVCAGYKILGSWGIGSCWQDGLAFVRYLVCAFFLLKVQTRRDGGRVLLVLLTVENG